jgi:hypothetical protein
MSHWRLVSHKGKGESPPGFLLVMAGVQEKLTKACEALRLTIEQVQLLYAFTTWYHPVPALFQWTGTSLSMEEVQ